MTTLGTIDFADAFHTLFAHPSERGKLVFEAFGKWYVYRRIPFGLASAPLLWARLAAACMRVSQALWPSWRLRLQCYVDDPAYAIFGNPRPLLAQLFLFWEVLGCKMAYKKGSLAKAIEWIGVSIATGHDPTHGLYVKLSIPHAKLGQLKQEICSLLAANLVDCKQLVSAASRMSWIGGILPWMRGFASCLWATVSAQSGGKSPRATVQQLCEKDRRIGSSRSLLSMHCVGPRCCWRERCKVLLASRCLLNAKSSQCTENTILTLLFGRMQAHMAWVGFCFTKASHKSGGPHRSLRTI